MIHLFVVQILNREVEIYTRYICDTQVLKSCRSNMATLGHDVCNVHGASSLYKKTCWQGLDRVFPIGGMGKSPPPTKNLLISPLPTTFLFPPTEGQFNLIKTFLAVVIVPVPFLF